MKMLSAKHGMGEVYRVHAQIRLIQQLKESLGIQEIYEFPPEPISADFPINWKQTPTPCVSGDLLFTWRAFPRTICLMNGYFDGPFLMFMATNKWNPGVFFQKLFWHEPEIYLSIKSLERLVESFNLKILKSGYYDSPLWPDAPLPGSLHIKTDDRKISDSVSRWERIPGHFLRAHHVYCVGERKI